jgi:hypothetical protein
MIQVSVVMMSLREAARTITTLVKNGLKPSSPRPLREKTTSGIFADEAQVQVFQQTLDGRLVRYVPPKEEAA